MSRAPNVLVSGVVLGQPMGGVRRHNQELLPRVARLLHEHGGALTVMEGRERVAFDLPAPIERASSDVPARPLLSRARAESRALRRVLEEARAAGRPFDVVHTAHLPAPRGLVVPYTITLHDLRSITRGHAPLPRRLVARRIVVDAARRAARVFTVSRAVAEELRAVAGLDESAITVIGNGGDHFVPRPRPNRVPSDAPLVCIGHLEPRKNLEIVLHALALDATLPRVVFHGAEKPGEIDRLRALARRLGVETRVTFAGPFDDADLPSIHAGAACVCLPSTIEGFGIGAVEAQRAGVPLAIARVPALVETAGADAFSFAPDDAAQLAAAVHRAVSASADELDRAARRADSFTWDAAARRWFDGWSSLARPPRAS